MSNIFENKGAFAATIVVAASDSLNQAAANYVCDGVADDVEINAALAALPVASGRVLLLEGNYTTIANIVVPANATLEGQGKATIITPTGAAITHGIVLNGDNITLKDMKVILAVGAGAGGSRPNVVYANTRTLLRLENLWLVGDTTVANDGSDLRQNGICFITCTYCKVANCLSQTNMRHGIWMSTAANYNTVTGNTCAGNSVGIFLHTAANYNTLTGNTCTGNVNYGIGLINIANYNTVTGNTCAGNSVGIFLYNSSHNTLTGNTCAGNSGNGISLDTTASYNTLTGNTCQGSGGHNIYIYRSSYCVVTGNSCNGSTAGDGINVTGDGGGNSDYNTLTGNVCTGNGSDGIEIAGGANANKNIVLGNQLLGNAVNPLLDNGVNTEVAHSITV